MTTQASSEHGPDILPHRAVKRARPASRGLLSIVIPCHNEEEVIESTHRRLVAALPSTGMDFEILYIDDGSRDQTLSRLEAIAAADHRATVIELSRNFGQQSAMSAGLARARGDAVVIIDADLRQPTQHLNFGLPNRMGLSGILSHRAGLEEIVAIEPIGSLSVLPAGPQPPNPQELLGRPEFARLLDELSSAYDVILIDTPSAQQSSDAHVIAQRAGAAVVVGRKGRTRSAEIGQLASIMTHSGIRILGTTLNEL
jgi:receptor protein-tyrosine kinase